MVLAKAELVRARLHAHVPELADGVVVRRRPRTAAMLAAVCHGPEIARRVADGHVRVGVQRADHAPRLRRRRIVPDVSVVRAVLVVHRARPVGVKHRVPGGDSGIRCGVLRNMVELRHRRHDRVRHRVLKVGCVKRVAPYGRMAVRHLVHAMVESGTARAGVGRKGNDAPLQGHLVDGVQRSGGQRARTRLRERLRRPERRLANHPRDRAGAVKLHVGQRVGRNVAHEYDVRVLEPQRGGTISRRNRRARADAQREVRQRHTAREVVRAARQEEPEVLSAVRRARKAVVAGHLAGKADGRSCLCIVERNVQRPLQQHGALPHALCRRDFEISSHPQLMISIRFELERPGLSDIVLELQLRAVAERHYIGCASRKRRTAIQKMDSVMDDPVRILRHAARPEELRCDRTPRLRQRKHVLALLVNRLRTAGSVVDVVDVASVKAHRGVRIHDDVVRKAGTIFIIVVDDLDRAVVAGRARAGDVDGPRRGQRVAVARRAVGVVDHDRRAGGHVDSPRRHAAENRLGNRYRHHHAVGDAEVARPVRNVRVERQRTVALLDDVVRGVGTAVDVGNREGRA